MTRYKLLGAIVLLAVSPVVSGCSTYYDWIYSDSGGYGGTYHLQNSVAGRKKLEALCQDAIARQSADDPIKHFSLSDLKDYEVSFEIEDKSPLTRVRLTPYGWPTDKPLIECAFKQNPAVQPQLVISYPFIDHSRLLHQLD